MKLTYKNQIIITVLVILAANILCTVFKHWIYTSAGFVISGLLWVIHPVLLKGAEVSKRTIRWTRIAGMLLILLGVFLRTYTY